jgi:hypothetical protein
MAKLIQVKTMKDARGSLSVLEHETGFPVRRVFYIYGVTQSRGGHGHLSTKTALIAVHGEIEVTGQTPEEDFSFTLNRPDQCLLLEKEDWHAMNFSKDAVLVVLASEEYSADDYFYEKYRP